MSVPVCQVGQWGFSGVTGVGWTGGMAKDKASAEATEFGEPERAERPEAQGPQVNMSDAGSLRAALAAVGSKAQSAPIAERPATDRPGAVMPGSRRGGPPPLPGSAPPQKAADPKVSQSADPAPSQGQSRRATVVPPPIIGEPKSTEPPPVPALTPLIAEAQQPQPLHSDPPARRRDMIAPEVPPRPQKPIPRDTSDLRDTMRTRTGMRLNQQGQQAPAPQPELPAQLPPAVPPAFEPRAVEPAPVVLVPSPPPAPEPPVKAAPAPALPPPQAKASRIPASLPPRAEPAPPAPEVEAPDTKRRQAKRRAAGPARDKIAANDDAPSIGGLIYALNQQPSRQPFQVAGLLTAFWAVIGVGLLALFLFPEMQRSGLAAALVQPQTLLGLAGIGLPIAAFWLFAILSWRAQELKLMSSAMTEVAVRLAEPDRGAEQSIATLGQAVRQQVHFMEEAVSRALGRAGELEALVHNEVAALDRAYQENETRIRALIQELGGERDALTATSGQMHSTLKSISSEVPQLIESLTDQQLKLSKIIEGAGENLIALERSLVGASGQFEKTFVTASNEINLKITGAADQLGNQLVGAAEKLGSRLLTASTDMETTLASRTDQLQSVLSEYTTALNTALGGRAEQMQAVFEEYTRIVDQTMMVRTDALDSQVLERTRALDAAFSERLKLFDETMVRSTLAIDAAVGAKAEALSTAMETHAKQLADTLGRQATDLDETLMHGINAVRRT
ncbi:MAG: hypothetical protein RL291_1577, partial [Pseudomonadota bacterium]